MSEIKQIAKIAEAFLADGFAARCAEVARQEETLSTKRSEAEALLASAAQEKEALDGLRKAAEQAEANAEQAQADLATQIEALEADLNQLADDRNAFEDEKTAKRAYWSEKERKTDQLQTEARQKTAVAEQREKEAAAAKEEWENKVRQFEAIPKSALSR